MTPADFGGDRTLSPPHIEALLCDADGNLFPSEEPAFEASSEVLNELLAELGIDLVLDGEELRRRASGRNFRSIAAELAESHGVDTERLDLERWVAEEKARVTSHLGAVLEPDPRVLDPLRALASEYELVVVSSSALSRLDACFRATALDELFPPEKRYSAEDSLAKPMSKPDPSIYRFATEEMGVAPAATLAIEDAAPGVQSAVGAGCPVVGNILFVPADEREARAEELRAHGAPAIVESWEELRALLDP